jgi:hypothetical protein
MTVHVLMFDCLTETALRFAETGFSKHFHLGLSRTCYCTQRLRCNVCHPFLAGTLSNLVEEAAIPLHGDRADLLQQEEMALHIAS